MGAGANTTLMSDTLQSTGLAVSATTRAKVWLKKKPVDLCACESEEHEHGVGAGANTTLMSDTLQSIGLAESSTARAKVWL